MKKKDFQERNQNIFKLRQQGKTFKHIGSLYNIGLSRVGQIYHREKENYDNADKWPPLKKMLSTRTQHYLENYFEELGYKNILNTPQKIAEMNRKELLRIKNLGDKSVTELLNALYELGYLG